MKTPFEMTDMEEPPLGKTLIMWNFLEDLKTYTRSYLSSPSGEIYNSPQYPNHLKPVSTTVLCYPFPSPKCHLVLAGMGIKAFHYY